MKSIAGFMGDLARDEPTRVAVTCGEQSRTRAELDVRAEALAAAYRELGVQFGDTVTVALPNGLEFLEATLAVWKLGAVPQPLSSRLPIHERRAIVELAAPALIVGVDPADHPEFSCVPAGYEPDSRLFGAEPRDDVVSPAWKIMTSGGSTGRPKLIVSGSSAELAPGLGSMFGMRPGGVVLVPGPMYHNAPFQWAVLGLLMGNHVVVLPRFDAAAALEAISRYQVDCVNLVPTMMSRMLRVIESDRTKYDLSSLRSVWHMGASCPPWVKEAWIELIGPEKITEVYGGTEAVAVTMITGAEWLSHRGSVGKPASGEMKVVGADGQPLPPGEVGEIYMRRPAGTPPTYRYVGAQARELDDWESLGDLGWTDSDGYLYISDRRVDMIVAGGANVYPAEVEAALVAHPAVGSAIVVGLPDSDLGQRVHAVIEAQGELTLEDVQEFLRDRLVRYKIPRSIHVVAEPLRDDADKARRTLIREQEIARLQGTPSSR